jgi:hypothetical protein
LKTYRSSLYACLSKSARYRAGICFQYVLVTRAGARLLLIDQAATPIDLHPNIKLGATLGEVKMLWLSDVRICVDFRKTVGNNLLIFSEAAVI